MPKLQEPLRLYNMFPRGFKDFVAMREYVAEVAKMGFNAIWINPLQEVTQAETKREFAARNVIPIDDEVTGSLYAAKSLTRLNKEFIQYAEGDSEEEIQRKGEQQLIDLVTEIKAHKMVPMFDLVLNHVAADFDLLREYQDAGFLAQTGSYHDVVDFNYAQHEDEIIANVWKGYIEKYTKKYGFEGVRVDAPFVFSLRNIESARDKIYQLLRENITNPIIFEEWLYSGYDTKKMAKDLLLEAGPNYVTTSLSYEGFRDEKGSRIAPVDYKNEVQEKERVIFARPNGEIKASQTGGVVNFSGNHDSGSLCADIFKALVVNVIDAKPELEWLSGALDEIVSEQARLKELGNGRPSAELHKLRILYESIVFGVVKIINDDPKMLDEKLTTEVIEMFLKEKLAIVALTGGGGFAMMSGDESGDIRDQSVFAATPKDVIAAHNPDDEYGDFGELLGQFAQGSPTDDSQQIIEDILANIYNLRGQEQKFCNFGAGPLGGKFDLRDFITEINHILSKMPVGKSGHWSELLFLEDKPSLIIVARTNGANFRIPDDVELLSQCDLIIMNIDKNKKELNDEDMHKIYLDFERKSGGGSFDGSYNHIRKANLYLGSNIENLSQHKHKELHQDRNVEIEAHEAASSQSSLVQVSAEESHPQSSPTQVSVEKKPLKSSYVRISFV